MGYVVDRTSPALQLILGELLEYTTLDVPIELGVVDFPGVVLVQH